jgi:hypothetical protein
MLRFLILVAVTMNCMRIVFWVNILSHNFMLCDYRWVLD